MKKHFIFIMFILHISCSQSPNAVNEQVKKESISSNVRYIIAINGLNLRSTNSITSEILTAIPFGEEVLLLKTDNKIESIGNQSGHWAQIQWKEHTGWAFDIFLNSKISEEQSLLYFVNTLQLTKYPNDNKEEYIKDSLKLVEERNGFYVITYRILTPNGTLDFLDTFSVFKKNGQSWKLLYSKDTWGYVKLTLHDVNGDSLPDLICWENGCCNVAVTIFVYLCKNNLEFSDQPILREPVDSEYHVYDDFEDEDFIVTDNQVKIISKDTKNKLSYVYIYNKQKNVFVLQ